MLYFAINKPRKGEKMTQLTAAQCAQTAGVSKRTIQNNIKQGKLSATRDESGFYLVDSSELMRVYPSASTAQGRAKEVEGAREIREKGNYEEKEILAGVADHNQSLEVENGGLNS